MIAGILGTFAGVLALLAAATWAGINTPEPAGHHHKPRKPQLRQSERQRRRHRRQAERSRDEATERLFAGMQVPPEIARDATHTDDDSCGRCGWHTEAGTAAGRAAELRQHLGKHAAAMSTGIWHYESLSAEQAQARGWTEPDGPLMPLPPEVDEDDWAESDQALCLCPLGPDVPGPPITTEADCPAHAHLDPADPLAVLGDDACADALVGPVQPQCRSGQGHGYDRCPGCDACRGCHPHDPGTGCLPYLDAVPVPRDAYTDLQGGAYAESTGQFTVAVLDEYERAHAGGA
jgi:hypothetical protein